MSVPLAPLKSFDLLVLYKFDDDDMMTVIIMVAGWFLAGRRATFESESDSNSMDDVEPDSDKDYDSDKDPAWKPHAATHGSAAATANVWCLTIATLAFHCLHHFIANFIVINAPGAQFTNYLKICPKIIVRSIASLS